MELEEAKTKLKGLDGGDALLAIFEGKISELNEESKNRRIENKSQKDRLGEIFKGLELDPETSDISKAISEMKTKGDTERKQGLSDVERLAETVESLRTDLNASQDREKAAAATNRISKRDNLISTALSKSEALPDMVNSLSRVLAPNVNIAESGEMSFTDDSGKAFDSIEAGVASYMEANPRFKQSTGNPGGGSPGNGGNQSNGVVRSGDIGAFSSNLEAIAAGEVQVVQ